MLKTDSENVEFDNLFKNSDIDIKNRKLRNIYKLYKFHYHIQNTKYFYNRPNPNSDLLKNFFF